MLIKSIESLDKGLNVFWNDDSLSCYPWFWLRDHSESKEDLHPDTKQRQIDSFSEPLNNTVNDIWLDGSSESIFIKWNDQSESSLSFELLQTMSVPSLPQSYALNSINIWNF